MDGVTTSFIWRGRTYEVHWSSSGSDLFVETKPDEPDLRTACLHNMQNNKDQLRLRIELDGNHLDEETT